MTVVVRVAPVLDRVIVWLVRVRARFYVGEVAYLPVVVDRRTSFQVLESVYRTSSRYLKLPGQTPPHPCLVSLVSTHPLSFPTADRWNGGRSCSWLSDAHLYSSWSFYAGAIEHERTERMILLDSLVRKHSTGMGVTGLSGSEKSCLDMHLGPGRFPCKGMRSQRKSS